MTALPALDPPAVRGLLHKYRTLQVLGDARLALMAQGADCFPLEQRPLRKATMKQLAGRFPGSLKELDRYDAPLIARRIDQLCAAMESFPQHTQPWMEAMHRYHAVLVMLLAYKRGDLHLCPGWLAQRAAHPPGGRLTALALDVVGGSQGCTAETVHHLLSHA